MTRCVVPSRHGVLTLPGLREEARALGNWRILAFVTDAMCQVQRRQRDWAGASVTSGECLGFSLHFGLRFFWVSTLRWSWARCLVEEAALEEAAALAVLQRV